TTSANKGSTSRAVTVAGFPAPLLAVSFEPGSWRKGTVGDGRSNSRPEGRRVRCGAASIPFECVVGLQQLAGSTIDGIRMGISGGETDRARTAVLPVIALCGWMHGCVAFVSKKLW
ncbi:unnamed protein product, partial [Ectocarpus sp. 8 AP-2014]